MRTRSVLASACALVLFAGGLATSHAAPAPMKATGRPTKTTGAPKDYRKSKGLSQPRYATVRESYEVKMSDGVMMYVEVVRPTAKGRFGTILELSPYHGPSADRSGTRIFPGPEDDDGNK